MEVVAHAEVAAFARPREEVEAFAAAWAARAGAAAQVIPLSAVPACRR